MMLMGEARRRADQGLPPRQKKIQSDSKKLASWLPITEEQKNQFYAITTRGAWIGIALFVLLWVVVRVIGPAAGWWTPADMK